MRGAFSVLASDGPARHRMALAGFGLLVALYVAILLAGYGAGAWLIDKDGHPIPTDFVNVWAAGHLTLQGHASAVYDWVVHKQVEVMAAGHDFDGYFGWHYPPPFLLLAAPLALMPYTLAHLAWMGASAPLYLAAMRRASAGAVGVVAALAFPAVLWNVADGQNGFLTAGLLGLGLSLLQGRPIAAGICFGLLTYKPQFGVLIPVALMAGLNGRAFLAAAVTALILAGVTSLAFGMDVWGAFLHSTAQTNQVIMVDGQADLAKLQSVFAIVRTLGGGVALAWSFHGLAVVGLAAGVIALWRGDRAFETKAAGLAIATLMASPYVYLYDLVVLAVPVAFLARHGLAPVERLGVVLAGALVLAAPFAPVPFGFVAMVMVGLLVAGRAWPRRVPVRAAPLAAG